MGIITLSLHEVLRGGGKVEAHRCPLFECALDGDVSTHAIDQGFCNRQPQTKSGDLGSRFAAIETVKDVFEGFRRDPFTEVLHPDFDPRMLEA